ncbi:MAG: response regulator [Chloroflexi bacterium]|nr:response regulator [Chloroflexota bacterium]
MEQSQFFRLVRDALNHLDDAPFLEASPLVNLLAGPGERFDGGALRRQVAEALEQLRPPQGESGPESSWRRYRCLYLRHVHGASSERVQEELRVSGRQMRRDHLMGLKAVAAILWAKRLRLRRPEQDAPSPTRPRTPTGIAPEGGPLVSDRRDPDQLESDPLDASPLEPGLHESSPLEVEVTKLGSSPPDRSLNVKQIVLTVVDTITPLAESRGVRIQLALPGQLPPITINRAVLRQALLNLLSLAVEGEHGRRVEIRGATGALGVELQVAISSSRPTAWRTADERIVTTERLIALQGGVLHLEGGESGHFAARLQLPVAPTATVLVIDDNLDFARLFRRYLWAGGYQMIQASTGSQAIRLAREVHPHVITLDVMMPALDGWETLQVLRRDEATSGIPVIVCSVLRERDLAFSLGAADFLVKPVTQQALHAALERCLASPLPAAHVTERSQ